LFKMSAIVPFVRAAGRFGVAGQTLRKTLAYRVGQVCQVRSYASGVAHSHDGEVAHAEKTPREEDIEYKATMDFLAQPEGPWQEGYEKQQKKFNTWLAAGAGFLLVSWAMGPFLADDMYELYYYPKDFLKNPPPFSMKEVAAEQLAKLEAGGEEEEEED